MEKQGLYQYIDENASVFEKMSDAIWDYAEVAFEETRSSKLQADFLREKGFSIKTPVGKMDTAFLAEYGSGKPVIAVLGEYDALPGLGQEADVSVRRAAEGNDAGHGCGHHLLGTAGVEAVCALQEAMKRQKLPGTIRYYGCPAEEGGGGKIHMIRAGAFEDVDVAISWHPGMVSGLMCKNLSCINVKFSFEGKSAHAALFPEAGRSALDAAELMNMGVQFLREHIPSHCRIHYAFEDAGGALPNIVQDHARLFYCVRSEDADCTNQVYERVCKIAQGAALMTETTFMPPEIVGVYSNIIQNKTLGELLLENMGALYPINYTDAEQSYAQSFELGENRAYSGDYVPSLQGVPSASTDYGDVSWVVPSLCFRTACYPRNIALHSWAATAQGKSSGAKRGMHMAGKLIAACAYDLLTRPELVERAKADFQTIMAGRQYHSLTPEL